MVIHVHRTFLLMSRHISSNSRYTSSQMFNPPPSRHLRMAPNTHIGTITFEEIHFYIYNYDIVAEEH